MSFPAYNRPLLQDLKNSQRRSGLIFETCWSSALSPSANPPTVRRAGTWVSPKRSRTDTTRHPADPRRVRFLDFGVGFWILRLWAITVAWVLQIEVGTCCPRRGASCHHLAPDASVICSCLPQSCRPGFSNSEGRYSFVFKNVVWKVWPILHQALCFFSWFVRIWLRCA